MAAHVTAQEKADLQHLNDRLANYMQRMRQLGKQQGDNGYKEALKQLEDEVARMRDMYERELDRLRGNLEAANRDRNALQQTKSKLDDTEKKLQDEFNRGRKALDDVQGLHRTLADREKEIAGLRALVQERDALLNHLRPTHDKLQKDVADLQRQLDDESKRRQALDAQLKKLQEKLSFDGRAGEDQKRDLENRLRAAHDIIANLEAKLKGKGDGAVQEALQKLRDQQAAELKRYQQEADDKLNRALATLKAQIDDDARKREALQRENNKLNEMVQQLQAQLRDLENQHNGCQRTKAALEDALNQEKQRAHNQTKDLERRLREHQDAILAKIQECNHARDLAVALKAEIDSYRALLDGEERRLAAMTASGPRLVSGSSPRATNGVSLLPKIGAPNASSSNGKLRTKIDATTYRRDYC